MIFIKKILCILLLLCLIFGCCSCKGSAASLKIYGANNKLLGEFSSLAEVEKSEFSAYLDIVIEETAIILQNKKGISLEKGKKQLFKKGYSVYTAFNEVAFKSIKASCEKYVSATDSACAMTDLNGALIAVYSSLPNEKTKNFALALNPPCSAFKPLSVYLPALEKGIISWDKTYEDSPYKQIKGESGKLTDWPANANKTYTYKPTVIYDAVKQSYNTVAVKCLAEVGVNNSFDFLNKSFSLSLKSESYSAKVYGEEEVLGNVALGYLTDGVSVVNMAGYYQCFANGGIYTEPKAVIKVTNSNGKEIYAKEVQKNQIVKPASADIMREFLVGVVKEGTGRAARCKYTDVAGKTGTDDHFTNNWFVGVTPSYSLAVWHGSNRTNLSPDIFSQAIDGFYKESGKESEKFAFHANIKQVVCCAKSGMPVSKKCTNIQMGYFDANSPTRICDIH